MIGLVLFWLLCLCDDDLKNGDDLKNEDDLQNEDDLKNEDDIKNENDLKNEDDLKKIICPPPFDNFTWPFFDDLSPQQSQDNWY